MLKRILSGLAILCAAGIATLGLTATTSHRGLSSGLTVHEWGTFTTVAGVNGRAVEWFPLGGPLDLPCFVERFRNRAPAATVGYGPDLRSAAASIQGRVAGVVITPYRSAPSPTPASPAQASFDYDATRANVGARVRMETPVLYFYSPGDVSANVRVGFPRGLMTEWYPTATVTQGDVGTTTLRDPAHVSTIEWKNVTITPGARPEFLNVTGPSHYFAARATDAAPLSVNGQAEKFLFYRGVANFDVPLSAEALEKGRVRVRNLGVDALPAVVLFENRQGRLGYRVHGALKGGKDATLDAPSLGATFASLRTELERTLVQNGLFPKEASAMVETWRASWFEEGTRVFYVFPPRATDAILPLQIDPVPDTVVRVFVGRMEVLTEASLQAVERAVTAGDTAALAGRARFFGSFADRIRARATDAGDRHRYRVQANALLTSYVARVTTCQ